MPKFGVLIVDDSTLLRHVLRSAIEATSDLFVVAEAKDGIEATALVKSAHPDVMTLDVQMPRLDGLTFLDGLMRLKPMPVVMCSSLTAVGCRETLQALEMGAVDFVTKPGPGNAMSTDTFAEEVIAKLRRALQLASRLRSGAVRKPTPLGMPAVNVGVTFANGRSDTRVIAIGANTGGIVSLATLLSLLPGRCPPIVIAQYLPVGVAEVMLTRLQKRCSVTVKFAEDGELLQRDVVLLAPPDRHVSIVLAGGNEASIHCDDGPPVDKARPSSTKLFASAVDAFGRRCAAILLSGVGNDGSAGLAQVARAGGLALSEAGNAPTQSHQVLTYGQVGAQHVETLARGLLALCE